MKTVFAKLKSNSGVTILVALLAFMVSAMISAVLINAAYTNAKRVAQTKEQNQQYLLVESSVKMIQNMMSECRVEFDCTETTTTSRIVGEEGSAGTSKVSWNGPESEDDMEIDMGSASAAVLDLITGGVVDCLTDPEGYLDPTNPTENEITVSGGDSSKIIKFKVFTDYSADFRTSADPDSRFDVTIQIYPDSEDSSDIPNAVTLKATGRCEETGWDIREGDFKKDDVDEDTEVRTDEQIYHYTITWGNFLVTKGISDQENDYD